MKFLWPEMLWLAVLLPVVVVVYLWLMRRRKVVALRYANLALIREAMGGTGTWKRHVPPALFLLALTTLILAAARPIAVLTLLIQQQTVLMVMDVSGSMRATDVAPDRITASQAAAKVFVSELPANVRIGVVAYAGTAQLVQPPTLSREDVLAAIDRFQLQRGTAIGNGLIIGLATLFPEANIDLSKITGQRNMPGSNGKVDKPDEAPPVAPGSYESGAIVLLTDGQNTVGTDPLEAAQMAASRGVKVFTVGFGTKEGEIIGFEGWSMRVRLDEDTLKKIANLTLGEYFHAGSGADLKRVYEALKSRLVFERKQTEVTVLFADAAALFGMLACALSVWWFGRVV
jgi:Ca-activated chloride channel homolog